MASDGATSNAAQAAAASAAQPASSWLDCASLVPIFEVAYDNGKWLPFTLDESLAFYQQAVNGESAQYTREH